MATTSSVNLVINAVDKASAITAGAVSKIQSQFSTLQAAFDKFNTRLTGAANINAAMAGVEDFGNKLVDVLKAPITAAMNLQSAMAEVKKVVDFPAPRGTAEYEKQVKQLQATISDLSTAKGIPVAVEGLMQITAAGGQLGVSLENLPKFTETVAKMSTAFDMLPDVAGDAMAKLANVYELPVQGLSKIGDAINALSNQQASTAADIVEATKRTGGIAKIFGLTAEQAAALSSTFVSLGKQPEIAATSISSMLRTLKTATTQDEDFQKSLEGIGLSAEQLETSINQNAQVTLLNFLKILRKVDKNQQMQVLTGLFNKENAVHIASLVGGLGEYEKALKVVGKEADYLGSMEDEFRARSETTANSIQLLQNRLTLVAVSAGELLLPTFDKIVKGLSNLVDNIGLFITAYPDLIKNTLYAIGGFGAFLLTIASVGKVSFIANAALASLGLSISLIFSPLGLLAASLSAVAVLAYRYWGPLAAFFQGVATGFRQAFSPLEKIFGGLSSSFAPVISALRPIVNYFQQLFFPASQATQAITSFANAGVRVGMVLGSVVRVALEQVAKGLNWLGQNFGGSGAQIINTLAAGVVGAAKNLWNAILSVFDWIENLFPHSPAKAGPFSDLLVWGFALVRTFAEGIWAEAGVLWKKIEAVFEPISSFIAGIDWNFTGVREAIAPALPYLKLFGEFALLLLPATRILGMLTGLFFKTSSSAKGAGKGLAIFKSKWIGVIGGLSTLTPVKQSIANTLSSIKQWFTMRPSIGVLSPLEKIKTFLVNLKTTAIKTFNSFHIWMNTPMSGKGSLTPLQKLQMLLDSVKATIINTFQTVRGWLMTPIGGKGTTAPLERIWFLLGVVKKTVVATFLTVRQWLNTPISGKGTLTPLQEIMKVVGLVYTTVRNAFLGVYKWLTASPKAGALTPLQQLKTKFSEFYQSLVTFKGRIVDAFTPIYHSVTTLHKTLGNQGPLIAFITMATNWAYRMSDLGRFANVAQIVSSAKALQKAMLISMGGVTLLVYIFTNLDTILKHADEIAQKLFDTLQWFQELPGTLQIGTGAFVAMGVVGLGALILYFKKAALARQPMMRMLKELQMMRAAACTGQQQCAVAAQQPGLIATAWMKLKNAFIVSARFIVGGIGSMVSKTFTYIAALRTLRAQQAAGLLPNPSFFQRSVLIIVAGFNRITVAYLAMYARFRMTGIGMIFHRLVAGPILAATPFVIRSLTLISTTLYTLVMTNPFTAIIVGLTLFGAGLYWVLTHLDTVFEWFAILKGWLNTLVSFIANLSGWLDSFKGKILDLNGALPGLGTALGSVVTLAKGIIDVFVGLWNTLGLLLTGDWSGAGQALLETLGTGLIAGWNALKEAFLGILQVLGLYLPSSDAKMGPLSRLTASGASIPATMATGVTANGGFLATAIGGVFAGAMNIIRNIDFAEVTMVILEYTLILFRKGVLETLTGITRTVISFFRGDFQSAATTAASSVVSVLMTIYGATKALALLRFVFTPILPAIMMVSRGLSLLSYTFYAMAMLNPVTAIVVGITALGAAVVYVYRNFESLINWFDNLREKTLALDKRIFGLGTLFNAFVELGRGVIEVLGGLGRAVVALFKFDLKGAGMALLETFGAGIYAGWQFLKQAILGVLGLLGIYLPSSDAKAGPLSNLTASGMSIPATIAAGLLKMGAVLRDAFFGLLTKAFAVFAEADWSAVGTRLMQALVSGVTASVSLAIQGWKLIIDTTWQYLSTIDWSSIGEKLITSLATGIKRGGSAVVNAMRESVPGYESAIQGVSGLFDKFLGDPFKGQDLTGSGQKVVQSLGQGIKQAGAAPVKQPLGRVIDSTATLLPHSDAKEGGFSQLTAAGQAIPETMGEGILASGDVLGSSLEKGINGALPLVKGAGEEMGAAFNPAFLSPDLPVVTPPLAMPTGVVTPTAPMVMRPPTGGTAVPSLNKEQFKGVEFSNMNVVMSNQAVVTTDNSLIDTTLGLTGMNQNLMTTTGSLITTTQGLDTATGSLTQTNTTLVETNTLLNSNLVALSTSVSALPASLSAVVAAMPAGGGMMGGGMMGGGGGDALAATADGTMAADLSGGAALPPADLTGVAHGRELGVVSRPFESGSSGVHTISSGKGDAGGKSYGEHQLASKTGTLAAYINSAENAKWKDRFKGVAVASTQFDAIWKDIASKEGDAFAGAQHAYIKRTHYDPAASYAQQKGFDVNNRAVQEMLYSGSVQHGKFRKVIDMWAQRVGNPKAASNQQLIDTFYSARTDYVKTTGANVGTRYQRERDAMLKFAAGGGMNRPAGGAGAAPAGAPALVTGGGGPVKLDTNLRVKGGMSGQAFAGGKTHEGTVALAQAIQGAVGGGLNRFTAFNDKYHQGTKSKHTTGTALDFTINNAAQSAAISEQVRQMGAKMGVGLKVIDEYKNPTARATGGHIHVNFTSPEEANKFMAQIKGGGLPAMPPAGVPQPAAPAGPGAKKPGQPAPATVPVTTPPAGPAMPPPALPGVMAPAGPAVPPPAVPGIMAPPSPVPVTPTAPAGPSVSAVPASLPMECCPPPPAMPAVTVTPPAPVVSPPSPAMPAVNVTPTPPVVSSPAPAMPAVNVTPTPPLVTSPPPAMPAVNVTSPPMVSPSSSKGEGNGKVAGGEVSLTPVLSPPPTLPTLPPLPVPLTTSSDNIFLQKPLDEFQKKMVHSPLSLPTAPEVGKEGVAGLGKQLLELGSGKGGLQALPISGIFGEIQGMPGQVETGIQIPSLPDLFAKVSPQLGGGLQEMVPDLIGKVVPQLNMGQVSKPLEEVFGSLKQGWDGLQEKGIGGVLEELTGQVKLPSLGGEKPSPATAPITAPAPGASKPLGEGLLSSPSLPPRPAPAAGGGGGTTINLGGITVNVTSQQGNGQIDPVAIAQSIQAQLESKLSSFRGNMYDIY